MSRTERLLLGVVLGALFPILLTVIFWWGTIGFLPERLIRYAALLGLLAGLIIDQLFLRKWTANAYRMSLRLWAAVYLFYSIGLFGFLMGVPVLNVALAVPAGTYVGARLARRSADETEVQAVIAQSSLFTTLIMTGVCLCSATVALLNRGTAQEVTSMLRLPFPITQSMLILLIVLGGIGLIGLTRLLTNVFARRTFSLISTV